MCRIFGPMRSIRFYIKKLKGVKHPANSGRLQKLKSKYIFETFLSHFGIAVAKMFSKRKDIQQ